jgi:hypothetical protein
MMGGSFSYIDREISALIEARTLAENSRGSLSFAEDRGGRKLTLRNW